MKVSIFGSTGSIGVSTLDVIEHVNTEMEGEIEIDTLVAGNNCELIVEQALKFRPANVVLRDETCLDQLRSALSSEGITCAVGESAVLEAAVRPVDKVMAAISGTSGLLPTWKTVEAGIDILLANKEAMVCAGPLLKDLARKSGASIIPVDSEHNAIFQCLEEGNGIREVVLTASGGPFLKASIEEMAAATPAKALAHPNWAMGAKNSLDSATMMNKGLELIEAVYLFEIEQSFIDVVVHPQSIIHSMVSYADGSCIAQLGVPDMKTPIAYALSAPSRYPTSVKTLSLVELGQLDFMAPDRDRFPAIDLARRAADAGMAGTSVYNAANEFAGYAFLQNRCGFLEIAEIVEFCLNQALDTVIAKMPHTISTIDDVLQITDLVSTWVDQRLGFTNGKRSHVAGR